MKGQFTLRFVTLVRGKLSPFYTKLDPEKNLLVLIKNPIFIANKCFFYACPRTSALCTLFVRVNCLLVPDTRTVLNVNPW